MLNLFSSSCVYLSEMIIALVFFSGFNEYKRNKASIICIGLVLYEMEAVINVLFSNTVWLNGLMMFAVTFLFVILCFQIQLPRAAFFTATLVILSAIIEFIVIFTISAIFKSDTIAYNSDIALLLIIAITSKTLYFFVSIILLRHMQRQEYIFHFPAVFYFYAAGTVVSAVILWYVGTHTALNSINKYLLASVCILLFCFLLFVFFAYQNGIRNELYSSQKRSDDRKTEVERAYYKILERQNQELMMCVHDTKKHLNALHDLSSEQKVREYAERVTEEYDNYAAGCQSGNKMLDLIIDKYVTECQMKSISFWYDVRSCNFSNLSDSHIVSIFGNLLDNAVLAASQSSQKKISLETGTRDVFNVLVICNSCDTPPIENNGHLLTTQKEHLTHGYGLSSVKRDLKKYNGDLEWIFDNENCEFTVTAMIVSNDITETIC